MLEQDVDPTSAEGRQARSAAERERMRRSRYHLATSRVIVQVNPNDPTDFAGMVAPDGTAYIIAVTNPDFIPVVWRDPHGRTVAIGMPDLLRSSNPHVPIGIDPFWEDPLTIRPQTGPRCSTGRRRSRGSSRRRPSSRCSAPTTWRRGARSCSRACRRRASERASGW